MTVNPEIAHRVRAKSLLRQGLAGSLVVTVLTSCMQTSTSDVVMTVAPNKVPCYSVGTEQCLLVKFMNEGQPASSWFTFHAPIQNFNHESGYRYDVNVTVTTYSAGFIGDPNPPEYRLKQVISKTLDSETYSPGQP